MAYIIIDYLSKRKLKKNYFYFLSFLVTTAWIL